MLWNDVILCTVLLQWKHLGHCAFRDTFTCCWCIRQPVGCQRGALGILGCSSQEFSLMFCCSTCVYLQNLPLWTYSTVLSAFQQSYPMFTPQSKKGSSRPRFGNRVATGEKKKLWCKLTLVGMVMTVPAINALDRLHAQLAEMGVMSPETPQQHRELQFGPQPYMKVHKHLWLSWNN